MRFGLTVCFGLSALVACGGRSVSSETESGSATEASEAEATEGEAEASTAGETTAQDSGGTEGGDACVNALAIDTCCSQPTPATPEDVEMFPCLVQWPVDWDSIPAEVRAQCLADQPTWCETVDCDYAAPPSEVVELGDEGACAWVCTEGLGIGYTSRGCGEPPPIAECLPPPQPCFMDYCSCEGETISGCGYTGEPHASTGPCE